MITVILSLNKQTMKTVSNENEVLVNGLLLLSDGKIQITDVLSYQSICQMFSIIDRKHFIDTHNLEKLLKIWFSTCNVITEVSFD